jgi:hypothetical protein
MKLSELEEKTDAIRQRSILATVNAIYMANREEFETTTVCNEGGMVKYIYGRPKAGYGIPDGEQIAPGVIWRSEGGLGRRPDLPAWKIRNNISRAEANERAMMRAYPV